MFSHLLSTSRLADLSVSERRFEVVVVRLGMKAFGADAALQRNTSAVLLQAGDDVEIILSVLTHFTVSHLPSGRPENQILFSFHFFLLRVVNRRIHQSRWVKRGKGEPGGVGFCFCKEQDEAQSATRVGSITLG